MMVRLYHILSGICLLTACIACKNSQPVGGEIFGVYTLYPEPALSASDAPDAPAPPEGYSPVYISHYGRHGSRYVLNEEQYDSVNEVLTRASEQGVLTRQGQSLYNQWVSIYPELKGRAGLLTPEGERQHEGIATRMTNHFPELFSPGDSVCAISSNTQRTMASMEAFCGRISAACPQTVIIKEAPGARPEVTNPYSSASWTVTQEDIRYKSADAPWRPAFESWCRNRIDTDDILSEIFTRPDFVHTVCEPLTFVRNLFEIWIHLPGTPVGQTGLQSVFTDEEMKALAECATYTFYMEKGPYPAEYQRSWQLSAYILEDILEKAECDMASGGVTARLRFGHDGCIMALLCLMGVEPWCTVSDDPETFCTLWDVSQIPMGCNLQFIFYESPTDEPIMMAMLNEQPLTLPLKPRQDGFWGTTDFFSWYSAIVKDIKAKL